jgi:hypothetical protein
LSVDPSGPEGRVSKDLIVGSAGMLGMEGLMAAHLAGLGLKRNFEKWLAGPNCAATISCLNGASVVEFLRHVVHCEGYSDESIGFAAGQRGKSRYKNVPWWDNSIWLPTELERSGNLEGDPITFVGSCQALLQELSELQSQSPLQLGVVSERYAEMRTDVQSFHRSNTPFQLSDADCVRWVWLALRDGAEIAIKENMVMWAGPD